MISRKRWIPLRCLSLATLCFLMLVAIGCSTTGYVRVPDGAELYIHGRPVPIEIGPRGEVTTTPFSWSAAGGIDYRLERNGQVIDQGELQSKFRVVSIFWPPFAVAYWPMGFNPSVRYDLVNKTQR